MVCVCMSVRYAITYNCLHTHTNTTIACMNLGHHTFDHFCTLRIVLSAAFVHTGVTKIGLRSFGDFDTTCTHEVPGFAGENSTLSLRSGGRDTSVHHVREQHPCLS